MAKRERNVLRFNIQRKIVATMTTASWRHIPHVSFIYDADVTDFVEAYKQFDEATPYHITFNTVMLKALSEGIKAAPRINAHMHYEPRLVRGKLTFYDNIDISVPWMLPDGNMMTITMKDMGNKSLKEMTEYVEDINRRLRNTNLTEALYSVSIRDTMEQLRQGHFLSSIQRLYGSKTNPRHRVTPLKGREKEEYDRIPPTEKITIDDLKQGTITISNVGAAAKGIKGALDMLMIVPPQICAIGISSMQRRPTVITDEEGNEKVEIRTILPMCICFDHRALDFGEVSPFIKKMEEIFKDPWLVMN